MSLVQFFTDFYSIIFFVPRSFLPNPPPLKPGGQASPPAFSNKFCVPSENRAPYESRSDQFRSVSLFPRRFPRFLPTGDRCRRGTAAVDSGPRPGTLGDMKSLNPEFFRNRFEVLLQHNGVEQMEEVLCPPPQLPFCAVPSRLCSKGVNCMWFDSDCSSVIFANCNCYRIFLPIAMGSK